MISVYERQPEQRDVRPNGSTIDDAAGPRSNILILVAPLNPASSCRSSVLKDQVDDEADKISLAPKRRDNLLTKRLETSGMG